MMPIVRSCPLCGKLLSDEPFQHDDPNTERKDKHKICKWKMPRLFVDIDVAKENATIISHGNFNSALRLELEREKGIICKSYKNKMQKKRTCRRIFSNFFWISFSRFCSAMKSLFSKTCSFSIAFSFSRASTICFTSASLVVFWRSPVIHLEILMIFVRVFQCVCVCLWACGSHKFHPNAQKNQNNFFWRSENKIKKSFD